jgi:uncharacterized protein YciI
MNKIALIMKPGPNWNHDKGVREQAEWDEHARFVDDLFDRGLIMLAGPFVPEGTGALVILNVETTEEARALYANDPWAHRGILSIAEAIAWTIFLEKR